MVAAANLIFSLRQYLGVIVLGGVMTTMYEVAITLFCAFDAYKLVWLLLQLLNP